MFCTFYLIYLACLVALSALAVAQSCNTTGTYEACCPSSHGKVLLFDKKQYRVRCDYQYHVREAVDSTSSLEECARKCHGKGTCVGVRWQTPPSPGRTGRCDCLLDENLSVNPQRKHVSLTLVENPDNTTDINECNDELRICKADRQKDARACTTKVNECERDKTDAINTCNTDCTTKVNQCEREKTDAINTCNEDCNIRVQNCIRNCKDSKKKTPKTEFTCIGGKNWIASRYYMYECTFYAERNLEKKGQVVSDDRACGLRCNRKKGCKWAYYDSKTGICKLGRGEFKKAYLKKWGKRDRVVMHLKK